MPEARLTQTSHGRAVESDGWFVVNLGDAAAYRHERAGVAAFFEPREAPFPDFGINVRILEPGQPNGLYHEEDSREAFLVLAGECLVIVEEQERRLRRWDLVHCPAGTPHIFVGAGDGPCALLMVGGRQPDRSPPRYPVSKLAGRYGASVPQPAGSPPEAYGSIGWKPEYEPVALPWPLDERASS